MNSQNNDLLNYLLTQKDYVNNSSIQFLDTISLILLHTRNYLLKTYSLKYTPITFPEKASPFVRECHIVFGGMYFVGVCHIVL